MHTLSRIKSIYNKGFIFNANFDDIIDLLMQDKVCCINVILTDKHEVGEHENKPK